MDERFGLVAAAIDRFVKRAREQRIAATGALRQALAERATGGGQVAPNAVAGAAPARAAAGRSAAFASSQPAATPAGRARAPVPAGPSAAAREAGLVSGLFRSPQSLAAAFIAAEILAKPVALRDR